MHESARLNVFLGARNLNEHFLPPHLAYLGSFLRKRPMNLLFPFSVTISTAICGVLATEAAFAADPFDQADQCFIPGGGRLRRGGDHPRRPCAGATRSVSTWAT